MLVPPPLEIVCSKHQSNPVHCLVGSVLEVLQEHLSDGLSPATLKVYMATTSARHDHIDRWSHCGVASPDISLSSWCQTAEAYLQTISAFMGSFHSPGRIIRGFFRAFGFSIRKVKGGSVISINFSKKEADLQAL